MVPGRPASSLQEALARMTWSVEPGTFALIGFPDPPLAADQAALEPPAQCIREIDETTILVRSELAPAILARHPGARAERNLVWIRFEAALGWEVVGFLARVTGALAAEGVPIGAVCGYSRDHLFVAERHLATARAVLERLFAESPRGSAPAEPR